jgi:hypothetical protein
MMAKNKKPGAAERKKAVLEEKLLLGQINAERFRAFEQGENIGYTNATVIMLWLLRRKYGFGQKRLVVFLHDITDFCEAFLLPAKNHKEGEFAGVSLEDMCQALKDECDIDIDPMRGLIDVPKLERAVENE